MASIRYRAAPVLQAAARSDEVARADPTRWLGAERIQDEELAQHQVSMLLFLALACGIAVFGTQVLMPFTGSGNNELISSANTYAQVKQQASKSVRKASKLPEGVSAGGEKS
ncbi:unnamed protein product [Miscanthus lutarioriparius]|uniref:Uncharacterized protein n=1 Tax=Miscanthus lutarioriparius TaxID=422564 RepID=A0A811RA38_9POAL|nr:unnamed protein product [Miscanthus lutarioriparius]